MADHPQPPAARPARRLRAPSPPHFEDNILRFKVLGSGTISPIGLLWVLLGVTFNVIQIIEFLSPDPPKPEIEGINLQMAGPGKEVIVAGKNLGLVTKDHLITGLGKRVFSSFRSVATR